MKRLRKWLDQVFAMADLTWFHRFYNGGTRERSILRNAYKRLIRHINSIYKVNSSLVHLKC